MSLPCDVVEESLPHGTLLGTTACGIKGYATNYDQFKRDNPQPSYNFRIYENGIMTGIQWQCVEFARRYWLIHYNALLRNIPIAAEIWNQEYAWIMPLESGKVAPIRHFKNKGNVIPKVGDFLIYDTHPEQRTGHVAVVVEVLDNSVRVAEQNRYNDKLWPGNYSFEIPMNLTITKDDVFYDLDDTDSPALIGWVRLFLEETTVRPPWKPASFENVELGGPNLWKAVQCFLDTFPDGILGPWTIKHLQKFLNEYLDPPHQLEVQNENGVFDEATLIKLREFLNTHPKISFEHNDDFLPVNGEFDADLAKALHRFVLNVKTRQDVEFVMKSVSEIESHSK